MEYDNKHIQTAAAGILRIVQANWGREHSFQIVEGERFRHLDLHFYNRIESELRALGFGLLGDIEDLSMKESKPDPRTFLRILVSADAKTSAAIYHAKPRFPWPLVCWFFRLGPLRVFEYESEFEDGTVLSTTISSERTAGDNPPNLIRQYCNKSSSSTNVYKLHERRLNEIATTRNTSALAISSLEGICESQNRQVNRKRKHLENIGWVSREYLAKQLGKDGDFIEAVYQELQRLVRKQLITGEF